MTYIVGIDIAKYKHDCFIMDEYGEVIRNSFSFSNNSQGFNELLNVLRSLNSDKIKIGFEATGHYAINLKLFLEQNNFSFMELNPNLVKRFSKATNLRRTKTDKIDAKLIANYLTSIKYKSYQGKSYHIYSLKSLTRLREKLVKQRSQQLVNITNVLDLIFPEFKPFFNNSLKSKTALYILENYPSAKKIANMNINSYHKLISEIRGPKFSCKKFNDLKDLAKNTIGQSNDILEFELLSYIHLYNELDSKINDCEKKIVDIMKNIHTNITSIPGIGIISAASIYSEFGGNFELFSSANQLLAYAGLDPGISQSGTMYQTGKMVKHGSGYLRKTLMDVVMTNMIHIPQFNDYYSKKKSEGKCHRVALSHLVRKLLRVIYHLEIYNISFSYELLK